VKKSDWDMELKLPGTEQQEGAERGAVAPSIELVAFRTTRADPAAAQGRRRPRLREADADPGAGDPAGARRPRPDGRRADRHGQDRRLRAADPAAFRAAGEHLDSPARHPVRALVLTPTRELAVQVYESFRDYAKHLPLRSTVVYGGVDMNAQIAELRRGVEVLVATPGRLLDHVQNKTVMFNQVSVLVLDEADRMLDMGFMPDIKRIIALLPAKRQNLLFSATFPTRSAISPARS
jgi:hypothetical protein